MEKKVSKEIKYNISKYKNNDYIIIINTIIS